METSKWLLRITDSRQQWCQSIEHIQLLISGVYSNYVCISHRFLHITTRFWIKSLRDRKWPTVLQFERISRNLELVFNHKRFNSMSVIIFPPYFYFWAWKFVTSYNAYKRNSYKVWIQYDHLLPSYDAIVFNALRNAAPRDPDYSIFGGNLSSTV